MLAGDPFIHTGFSFKNISFRGAWVAQSVESPTLEFGSGHDPRVVGLSPTSGSALSIEPD